MFCRSVEDFPLFLNNLIIDMRNLLIASNTGIDVEVKKHKHNRTSAQNSYYWIVNTSISDFLNDSGLTYGEYNIPYTKDIIHLINKKIFGQDTTTKMSIGEFWEYMTKVILFWKDRTNGMYEVPMTPASYFISRGYDKEYLEVFK